MGELLSANAFYQLAKKSLAQAKLFDHKRREAERLRAQLSSLAGECGNEVRGRGEKGKEGARHRGLALVGAEVEVPGWHLLCTLPSFTWQGD